MAYPWHEHTTATRRKKRRNEQRYKAVLNAPLGRKAYWEYKTRHNASPSLHQLKTMRRSLVAKDKQRRAEKVHSFGTRYGLSAYEDVVTGRLKTVDSLERNLYSRMVDRQTHDEGELMRPDSYDPTPTPPTPPATPSHPVVTMIDTRKHAAFPLSSFRAGDMIVPRNNPSVVAVKIDNQSVMYLNTDSGAGLPSLVHSNFAGSLFMRPASVSVTVEL